MLTTYDRTLSARTTEGFSSHEVLTSCSRLEYESGGLAACFAMHPGGFVKGWYVGLFPHAVDPRGNSSVELFTRKL